MLEILTWDPLLSPGLAFIPEVSILSR
jgi:hypothetical protein